ncbi:uncharacterized protein [Anabrus simplex]|uniref:uncharacterized protein isoform X2 n=1 Tax=Anabrus simplex TaxID=316456 RepID=UPI0035A2F092
MLPDAVQILCSALYRCHKHQGMVHRGSSSPVTGSRATDMEDILIVSSRHSQAAALWVNYLNTCFEQISRTRNKPPFKILCVGVEDVVSSSSISVAMEEKLVRVKLQIVILCPQFLDHVYQHPGTILGRILQPDRVLAMLLGVEESSISEQHRAALASYQQWQRLPVKDQDESSVGDFLEVAMGILAKVSRNAARSERAMFSVIPKKVNKGQNKVIVLLNEPITNEDKIKIKVDKNGEHVDVAVFRKRNPYTLHFQMPECCLEVSMLASVIVEKNGQVLGARQVKCESRMRELDQILQTSGSPLEFMCQTLGFGSGDREQLDNFLVAAFQRNIPPNFNLLQSAGLSLHHRPHTSAEEYPTLLHFAARFGLEKLAWQLLECPGGEHACEIRNACDVTPAEMAEAAGHSKLANALRGYMQMTEFTSMYSYLKIISESNGKPTGFDNAEYHHPRPLSETYQIPPSARTLAEQNYQIPPTARPFKPTTSNQQLQETEPEMGGYMEMHPSGTNRLPFPENLDFLNTVAACIKKSSENLHTSTHSNSPTRVLPSSKSASQNHIDQISLDSGQDEKLLQTGAGVKKSHEQLNNGVQDELLEIISDFKNNIFTISEIEKLVENWKTRNDVQQSYKEKQEQLNQMREEYERLQQCIKDEMKRPTPFDRIRNFFKGKPKECKPSSNEISSPNTADLTKVANGEGVTSPLCQRPVSSLSLHSISSSSSSGRMSTLSGCSGTSLGDSGTHSDTEDRKICSPCDFNKLNSSRSGIHNYEIPPAPRPAYQICPPSHFIATPLRLNLMNSNNAGIENRPPVPVPRHDLNADDNYVTPEESKTVSMTVESESKFPVPQREVKSVWSDTEDRITAMIASQTPVIVKPKTLVVDNTDDEYLAVEGEHEQSQGPDYMNVVYPNSPGTNEHELADTSDLPEYVNVTLPEKSAPPIPPRQPFRNML